MQRLNAKYAKGNIATNSPGLPGTVLAGGSYTIAYAKMPF
jgi:hypothetical protein